MPTLDEMMGLAYSSNPPTIPQAALQSGPQQRLERGRAIRAADTNRIRKGLFDWLDPRIGEGPAHAATELLDFLPVAGDVSGAEDTYQAAKAGDWQKAAGLGGLTALGMFLGPAARIADRPALEAAQELARGGADATRIWKETGWFQGADGKWRFEIDDSPAALRLRPSGLASGPLGKVLQHQELSRAYPGAGGVKNIQTLAEHSKAYGNAGSYQSSPNEEIYARSNSAEDLKGVLLHEAQHAVQSREGFARGSNPGFELQQLEREWRVERDEAHRELANGLVNLPPDKLAIWKRFMSAKYGKPNNRLPKVEREVLGDPALRQLWMVENFMSLPGTYPNSNDAFKAYKRVAGEVEARNVETRRDMGPLERHDIPPWETEDVPRAAQIIRLLNELGKGP